MLVIDPAKRITIEQMLQDKWYNEGCESEPAQIISPSQNQTLTAEQQKAVLDELEELGLEREAVLKSINEGLYDSLSATYYLVADRRANGLPAMTPTKAPLVKPAAPVKPSSKVNMLEVLDEDADPDAPPPPTERKQTTTKKEEAPSTESSKPPASSQSATQAQPPRVVAGGRRRAATIDTSKQANTDQQGPMSATPGNAANNQVPPPLQKAKPAIPAEFSGAAAISNTPPNPPPEQPAPLPPIQSSNTAGRARAHTMATDKKQSDEGEEQTIPIDQFKALLKPGEAGEPRTARFTFSVSTTSTKDPPAVFEIVKKALGDGGCKIKTVGMVVTASLNDLEFEIEVCKLPNLQVVGLRCKRLMGDAWAYKELLSSLIATMNL